MATEMKLSVTCDRCKRVETRDAPSLEPSERDEALRPQFTAVFRKANGKEHAFTIGDLCSPCERTVENLIAGIEKKVEKKSPDRKGAKK